MDGLDREADLEVFEYTDYGRDFMKSCKCSPDVWLQLSLQVGVS
jgi:choline O-acetyltransferase